MEPKCLQCGSIDGVKPIRPRDHKTEKYQEPADDDRLENRCARCRFHSRGQWDFQEMEGPHQ